MGGGGGWEDGQDLLHYSLRCRWTYLGMLSPFVRGPSVLIMGIIIWGVYNSSRFPGRNPVYLRSRNVWVQVRT